MKITRVELRELRLPLVSFFETSFGRTTHRRIVLVRVEADGLTGWGEVTCGEKPFYSYETPETAWHIRFARFAAIPWRRRPWRMRCGILRRRKKAFPLQGFWAGRLKKFPAAFLSEFRRTLRYCSKRSSVNWPQATRGLRSK